MNRRLVILAEFELHPGQEPEFRRLVMENAAASLRDEPGCSQFDVLTPEGGPGQNIVLYEIYDDAAAFDSHLATTHFVKFNQATASLIARKTVRRLSFGTTT
jgi:(4S)-4-hydroxy-5-phosphonooxypentane-2,3-dione isomerase